MSESPPDLDRRQFAARVAACAAVLPAALAAMSVTDTDAVTAQEKPAAKDPLAVKPDTEEPKPAPFDPIALQLALLVGQYPSDELTPQGLRLIAGKLASQMAHAARLNSFPLTNGDGPGFVFSAYRGS